MAPSMIHWNTLYETAPTEMNKHIIINGTDGGESVHNLRQPVNGNEWIRQRKRDTREEAKSFKLKNSLDGLEWLCADTQKKAIRQKGREIISCIDLIYFTSFDQLYVLSIKFFARSFHFNSFRLYIAVYLLFSFYSTISMCAHFLLATKLNSCHSISGLLVEGGFQS